MAVLGQAFNASNFEDMANFEPIPVGAYLVTITKSSIEVTRAKTGKYISLEFTVMNGKFKGRKIWTNLNIINPNPETVEIAQKELATICRACGKPNGIMDTNEIHNLPMLMKVKITPATKMYPAKNAPAGYISQANSSAGLSGAGMAGNAASGAGETSGGPAPDPGPAWDNQETVPENPIKETTTPAQPAQDGIPWGNDDIPNDDIPF